MGSISIFKEGNEAYQRSFGFAELNKIKATKDTKYRIGSISKTFTAVIIMQMIDESKITLDTKLSSWFPEIPNASTITIEALLRHRSGLFNFTNAPDYTSWMVSKHSKDDLLKKFIANGTVFKPDEKAAYSNTNYILLSLIAEKVDKKDFALILKDRIITPCKLEDTYYGGKIKPKENEAFSYTNINKWTLATETDMSVPIGAGAIVSNPTDLNIFYNQLFSGKLVSVESLSKMKKLVDGFGIGMFQIPFYERMAFGHTGGIDGFQSMIGYFPDEKVSIAYTSNGVVMPMNDILIGALSIYFGKDYILPDFKPAMELTSAALDKYLGVYSSPDFPLKVTITKNGNTLIGQATGQPSFPLEAFEKDKFKFDQAMLKLEFQPDESKMILKQRGGEFELKKE
jgi:CubicO group peptidase (beta-lactamase class C family)